MSFTFTQSAGVSDNGLTVSSLATTFSLAVSVGDLIVCGVVGTIPTSASALTLSISDGANTYQSAGSFTDNVAFGQRATGQISYSVATTGGTLTLTVTPSLPGRISMGIASYSFSGILAADGFGSAISGTPNTIAQSSNVTVSSSGELLFGFLLNQQSSPDNYITAPFNLRAHDGAPAGFAWAIEDNPSASASAPVKFTISNADPFAIIGASFATTPGGGGGGGGSTSVFRPLLVSLPSRSRSQVRLPRFALPQTLIPSGSSGGPPPGAAQHAKSSARRTVAGRVMLPRATPPSPPIQTHPWKITAGGQPRQRGRATSGVTLPPSPPIQSRNWKIATGLTPRRAGRVYLPGGLVPHQSQAPPLRSLMVGIRHRWQPGSVRMSRTAPQEVPNLYMRRPPPIVCCRESELRQIRGRVQWLPSAPLFGPVPPLGYHIYSNAGSGPINYNSPIATVYTTTWTSGPLAFPDTWMFGVRAFNGDGEELNLDASVTIILDANGNDITNRPKPPFAMRAFARAGGAIRAEWSYNTINPQPVPTGFHVYLGVTGVLSPVSTLGGSQTASAGSARWTGGALTSPGLMISQAGRRGSGGGVQWRNATGGGVNYTTPVATVSFQSAIAGSFVANIPGLINGVTYQVGVRAYNAVAEEPNTSTVTVTADSVGPGPVVSLTAVATA